MELPRHQLMFLFYAHVKSYLECKNIILDLINRKILQDKQDLDSSSSSSSSSLTASNNDEPRIKITQEDYEQLVELLIFHIMFRLNEIKESFQFLEYETYLSPWKKEGFIKSLHEMVHIREIEEKNQIEKELQIKKLIQQQELEKQQELELQQKQQQLQLQQQQQQLINSQNSGENQTICTVHFN
eukprot:gene7709-9483_t